MIEFKRHPTKIEHVNPRIELHGDERHTVLDLRLSCDLPNTALDELSPTLRASLFSPPDDLLGHDEEHLTVLKNPELGALAWGAPDVKPVSITLHLGGRARDDFTLSGAKLSKMRLRPQNGGTFGFTFRLQVETHNNEASKLHPLMQSEVPATLNCSEAEVVIEDEDE